MEQRKITAATLIEEYNKGKDYNRNIDLYETCERNMDFYHGDQWKGVLAPDLEKPVFNIIKRILSTKIAMIVSSDIAVSFESMAENVEATPETLPAPQAPAGSPREELSIFPQNPKTVCDILGNEIRYAFERTRFKEALPGTVNDAALTGDGCFYWYWKPQGLDKPGEMEMESLEGTKVMFGNPHQAEAQKQPYILIASRQYAEDAKEYCLRHGMTEDDAERIHPDEGGEYADESKRADGDLVTLLTELRMENTGKGEKTVVMRQEIGGMMIGKPVDTGLRLYPVAWWNWEAVKNCCHGRSDVVNIIPNQIEINKLMAMGIEHQKRMAFPKLFYDMTKIREWTNKIGQAVGVAGDPNTAVAMSTRGADMSSQVMEMVDRTITYTKDCLGASDAVLGNIRADNTSAIIAVQKASTAPLELQKSALRKFVEDNVRIMLELIRVNYGLRDIRGDNEEHLTSFDFERINYDTLKLAVEVGEASYWSEITQIQTLDALFQKGVISDKITYLEALPNSVLPNKQKFIEKLKEQEAPEQAEAQNQGGIVSAAGTAPSDGTAGMTQALRHLAKLEGKRAF